MKPWIKILITVLITILVTIIVLATIVFFTIKNTKSFIDVNYTDDIEHLQHTASSAGNLIRTQYSYMALGLLHSPQFVNTLISGVESGRWTYAFLDQFLYDNIIPIYKTSFANIKETLIEHGVPEEVANNVINKLQLAISNGLGGVIANGQFDIQTIKKYINNARTSISIAEATIRSYQELISDAKDDAKVCMTNTDTADNNFIDLQGFVSWDEGAPSSGTPSDPSREDGTLTIHSLTMSFENPDCSSLPNNVIDGPIVIDSDDDLVYSAVYNVLINGLGMIFEPQP